MSPAVSFVLKSLVNSLPVEIPLMLVFITSKTEMMKSPPSGVVTDGPGVLVRVTVPMAVFVAPGGRG
jgi:hypothetical protein